MRRFTYADFTEEARETVVTAAALALSKGTEATSVAADRALEASRVAQSGSGAQK